MFYIYKQEEKEINIILYLIPINICICNRLLKCDINEKNLIIYRCNNYYGLLIKLKNKKVIAIYKCS